MKQPNCHPRGHEYLNVMKMSRRRRGGKACLSCRIGLLPKVDKGQFLFQLLTSQDRFASLLSAISRKPQLGSALSLSVW